jgi:hypothetical protein
MMRTGLALIASVWLTGLVVGSARSEPLTFAGFHRDMGLAVLVDQYKRSSHDINPSNDARTRGSQDNLKEWIRDFFRTRGSGTYVVRLTPDESFDHVYYIQANIREGITERLWLLLEKPSDMATHRKRAGGNETRYPACNKLLKPLTARYGKPDARAPRWEEALLSFDYVWMRLPDDAMKLECGRYRGRKSVFAIGVTFEQPAVR